MLALFPAEDRLDKLLGPLWLLLTRRTSQLFSSGVMTLGQDKGHGKTRIEVCAPVTRVVLPLETGIKVDCHSASRMQSMDLVMADSVSTGASV